MHTTPQFSMYSNALDGWVGMHRLPFASAVRYANEQRDRYGCQVAIVPDGTDAAPVLAAIDAAFGPGHGDPYGEAMASIAQAVGIALASDGGMSHSEYERLCAIRDLCDLPCSAL